MELQTMPLRFRVWDREEEKFTRSVTVVGPQNWPCRFNLATGYFEMESDERFTISQDTGLKDSHGKSIFTGDIVKLTTWADALHTRREYAYFEIIYNNGAVMWQRRDDYTHELYSGAMTLPLSTLRSEEHGDTVEVVGHIWKDKKLLDKPWEFDTIEADRNEAIY